jgi:hypothetical protein
MITAARYAEITGDTTTAASAVSARIEDAVELLEDYLDRPLSEDERTESLIPDRWGRLWPRATPISDGGDYAVDGLALQASAPFGWPSIVSASAALSVTYTGGWTSDTLPTCIERDLAWATYRLLHPEAVASLTAIPAGVSSARLGDAALTWGGSAGLAAAGDTAAWWSKRTRSYRYAPVHSGPTPYQTGVL